MPASRRSGRDRIPLSDLRDEPDPNPFRDDDDAHNHNGHDRMLLPKPEFLLNPRIASRRWKCFGIFTGILTLVGLALFVAGGYDMLPEKYRNLPAWAKNKFSGEDPQPPDQSGSPPLPPPTETSDYAFIETKPEEQGRVRKGLVMASYKTQTVGWMQNLHKYTRGWETYRYIADDPNTDFLRVPTDLGREAISYLTFIIDNYDDLPDFAVFVHGHDRAWHQPEHTIDKLMALNLTAVIDEGYVNLRCGMSPGCTDNSKFYFNPRNTSDTRPGTLIEEGFWRTMMEEEFGGLPATFGRRCCAQFAVTKTAIRLRSHEFWKSLRRPLEGDMNGIKKLWGPNVGKYELGSLYEQIWHMLFGMPADFCPSRETCEKVHFQDIIQCDGETTSFKENKGNWNQIKCTNSLRHSIDLGTPLEEVIPDDKAFPALDQTGNR